MITLKEFLTELQNESVTTRKMLSRIPNDKFSWRPHEKSMTIERLTTHIAELPNWISMVLNTNELDFANNPYDPKQIKSTAALLEYFEECLKSGISALETGNEMLLTEPWILRNGEKIYSSDPKSEVIRMTLNQVVHHRAQLGVYLRLLDVPIPGSYGPSADENEFA